MNDDDFLFVILTAAPDEVVHRLAYADWLEERGDPRAEFVRLACQRDALGPQDPARVSLGEAMNRLRPHLDPAWVSVVDRVPERWQVETDGQWGVGSLATPTAEWEAAGDESGVLETVPGRLYSFTFYYTDTNDDDLERFGEAAAGMGQLWALDVPGYDEITDRGILALGRLPQLRSLTLAGSGVATVAALAVLERLPNLTDLALYGLRQAKTGSLTPFASLRRLRRLIVEGTWFTDDGLHALEGLDRIENLTLNSPNLTDRGMESLLSLPRLESLDVQGCWKITDAGLAVLARIPRLKSLGLPRCSGFVTRQLGRLLRASRVPVPLPGQVGLITERGVERLQDALPECDVWQTIDLAALRSS